MKLKLPVNFLKEEVSREEVEAVRVVVGVVCVIVEIPFKEVPSPVIESVGCVWVGTPGSPSVSEGRGS